jgi:hypothetical protein
MVVSFIGGGNREYPEKTTDLSAITDKLVCLLLNVRVWEFVKVLEEINFCKTDMLLSFLRSTSSRGVLDTTLGDKVCQ